MKAPSPIVFEPPALRARLSRPGERSPPRRSPRRTTTRGTDQRLLDIRPIQGFEHALDRSSRIGPLRRRGEVQIQSLLLGVTNERPVIDEPPAVAVAQV